VRFRLAARAADDATVILTGRVLFGAPLARITYPTKTAALLRIDGAIAGAFDERHQRIDVRVAPGEYDLTLQVERRTLPTSGLPSGDGRTWRRMRGQSDQEPPDTIEIDAASVAYGENPAAADAPAPLVGHAHLDVAWLWRYADTRRKALRTFATALRQRELDGRFCFAQSQPQLYAWVMAADAKLFERVAAEVGHGWDASVASMWVEPDLHAISGESILRQFALGVRWMEKELEVSPTIAWLPDTFGFPSTFPQLAAHAGMRAFATAKLGWNETTPWPLPQFRWFGDDGSSVLAGVLDRYDGPVDPARTAIARDRKEPVVCGYGDGGGGVTDEMLAGSARSRAPWTTVAAWFDEVDARLVPEHRGELYLETHRGTYTTHRDVKARNAALEQSLEAAEELLAWCVAVRTPPSSIKPLNEDLQNARTILARNQFHDVIAGTSIEEVYVDVHVEYERAERIAERVSSAAASILPRADLVRAALRPCAPRRGDGVWQFANDYVRASVRDDGTVVALSAADGSNLVGVANRLIAYLDKPRAWDAWNLDAGYDRHPKRLRADGAELDDGGLVVRLAGQGVAISMRIELREHEPYLRVLAAVEWRASQLILRAEHTLAFVPDEVRFGQPHGTLVRPTTRTTEAERARFEVPAQRWVHAQGDGRGLAILTPDSYGWSAETRDDGFRLGTSLLRAPNWPDPTADRGEHRIAYALAPTAGAAISALETAWHEYAGIDRVRLFTCDDPAVLVVATKPADDGNGVIVRVRECDGEARTVSLRCGGRARRAEPVDACERGIAGDAVFDGEALRFVLPAYALRSFRVIA
jgi:alpha-mannosidase